MKTVGAVVCRCGAGELRRSVDCGDDDDMGCADVSVGCE